MRKKGIKIVLDDFGEGFTSFYDLQWYPFSVIKLDKHLIDYIDDKKGRMILQSMIDLGQKIGLKVCAEGVETQDQIRKLSEMRCDILQGFSVHRPEKADKVKEKLIGKSVR